KGAKLPVEQVSWNEIHEFLKILNSKSSKYNYRLPTEAEWEYACRAGSTEENVKDLDASAWYNQTSIGKSHPVGQKSPNAWGLYDMLGNVMEWCEDWYGPYTNAEAKDPKGPPSGSQKVFRGGAWSTFPEQCRSSFRSYNAPTFRLISIGFRLVRTPK